LEINFVAMDGREVNLAQMRGKVVLVDFWATWCGPCVAETPVLKDAYEKFNSRGFEIIGISFDSDRATLEDFVKANGLTWPQYFDGKYWENDLGRRFGIHSIPTQWLVDRKGHLRDLRGRDDLTAKVEQLLAE